MKTAQKDTFFDNFCLSRAHAVHWQINQKSQQKTSEVVKLFPDTLSQPFTYFVKLIQSISRMKEDD